jgi:DNA-binding GntR family transcriptional regulator
MDHPAEKLSAARALPLAEQAYDRLEELIIACELRPGQALSINDLQTVVQLGRTPIHQAVSRLASDTLIIIRPRHGLRIAPIDLTRDRTLLGLRRDMERFVVRLAAERSGPTHRNQFLHIARLLRKQDNDLDIATFNRLDRRIDQLMTNATGEPFLENTLRPLHTIFRRIGWVYHNWAAPREGLGQTVLGHLAMIEAVAEGDADRAAEASDRLMGFMDSVFAVIEREVDPARLDCTLETQLAG